MQFNIIDSNKNSKLNLYENKKMVFYKSNIEKKLDEHKVMDYKQTLEEQSKDTVSTIEQKIPHKVLSKIQLIPTKGDNKIHTLCRKKNIDFNLLKELIYNGLDINGKNDFDETPLLLAMRASNLIDIKKLISMGADIHATTEFGRDALASAFQNKDFVEREKIIKYLVNEEGFSMSDFPGKYLKYMIVNEDNRPYIMKMLPNMKEAHYKPNLNILLGYGRGDDEIVDFFMGKGLSMDTELLVSMSRSKNVSTDKLENIVQNEYLDINLGSRAGGNTPLMEAIIVGDVDKVEFYLESGADTQIKNMNGDDSFQLVQSNLVFQSIPERERIKIEELLKKYYNNM